MTTRKQSAGAPPAETSAAAPAAGEGGSAPPEKSAALAELAAIVGALLASVPEKNELARGRLASYAAGIATVFAGVTGDDAGSFAIPTGAKASADPAGLVKWVVDHLHDTAVAEDTAAYNRIVNYVEGIKTVLADAKE